MPQRPGLDDVGFIEPTQISRHLGPQMLTEVPRHLWNPEMSGVFLKMRGNH